MTTLTVDLGERSYPIYIANNVLGDAALYQRHIAGKKVLLVSDENVASHYLQKILGALSDFDCQHVLLPPGEAHKNLDTVAMIYDCLLYTSPSPRDS